MQILTMHEAQALLDPYRESVLVDPAVRAVAMWQKFVVRAPDLAAPLDETARANNIHCWWRTEVRRALGQANGIREVRALGFFAVAVDTNPLVRFKFLGDGSPSNVLTGQQRDLAFHRYDDDAMRALALDRIYAPPTILSVGYSLDAAAQLKSLQVRCDLGKHLLWRWHIWGDQAAGGGSIEPMPLPGTPSPSPAHVRSTRPLREDGEEEQS